MDSINFNVALKRIQQDGTLAWEYNPFRNYRLDEDMIFYKNQFYTIEDFTKEYLLGLLESIPKKENIKKVTVNNDGLIEVSITQENSEELQTQIISDWASIFPKTEEIPVVYQKGQLVDFITDEIDLDLNHPIQITPAYSYDNSVDLIINDGKNLPKIINSRFSAIGKNKYKIVDRNGNNDTNIYDRGTQFGIDTSLYKVTSLIPEIVFGGEAYGGNLKVGNYHFYFKYCDLDGNESDFVAQSGLVSVFLGNTPNSINTGFRDQNSSKKVRFILYDIDEAYDYIVVYYSRATSEEFQNRTTEYARIDQKYKVSRHSSTIIDITGFEPIQKVTFEDINQKLQVYDSAKTSAISQNMLFLGNTTQSYQDHDQLSRLALYIIPQLNKTVQCGINSINDYYQGDTSKTYYNPNFLYNYTGYWDDEIYRFGVVFIRNNNTLTPVYNVRGLHLQQTHTTDPNKKWEEDTDIIDKLKVEYSNEDTKEIEKLISYDETTFNIDSDFLISEQYQDLENAKGVCYIPHTDNLTNVIGITFWCHPTVIKILKDKGIKGYFIVRQKRIPTTLCQAYTVGVESKSHTPMLPLGESKYIYESFLDKTEQPYTYWNDDGKKKTDTGNLLSNIFSEHYREAPLGSVYPRAAICPDYDVNTPYLNSLFSGQNFVVTTQYRQEYLTTVAERLYSSTETKCDSSPKYTDVKIIGVEDNTKLVGIDDHLFSARAGEAEEAFRFSYVGTEVKKNHGGANLLRGSFGPYLGITGYSSPGDLITIKIPGYDVANLPDYFKIRYFDEAMFYPISGRIVFDDKKLASLGNDKLYNFGTHYRGDCYICKFTHRLNRNFRDATTPTNDEIVDPSTWTHHMNFEDGVMKKDDLEKINLGDVNAVNLGMWVTFTLRSSINHCIRSLNESDVDEAALIGHSRGFFPYYPISAQSAYKLPEAGTYNKGFEASVGEQVFEELPAVPYYKNTFSTRIAYSNIQITSAFKNAYRVFPANHYRDYPITYGEITKIIEWNGDLMCILEHGIYRIPINERAVAGEGSGGTVYINTSNVLPENPKVISDTFGSQWIDSIIKTPTGIYGVDTVAKKIWKVDDNGIELISDFKVQEFLNKNITLTERELTPIIGIRNVKTHYNAFKHDVMFTFYDDLHGVDEVAWNLCWNETMNKWITFYSWVPSFSENIYNSYFSFDRETSKQIAMLALNEKSEFHEHIYLNNTTMVEGENHIGKMNYDINFEGTNINTSCKWELIYDPYGNREYFELTDSGELSYKGAYSDYTHKISEITKVSYEGTTYELKGDEWYKEGEETLVTSSVLSKQLSNERKRLWKEKFEKTEVQEGKITKRKVYLLNVRVTPTIEYTGTNASFAEYMANKNANTQLTGGYIERTVAVIPQDHLEALSTDFWKHGQAGIIDIKEEVKPTYWYGKQHPFEFEFIVRDQPDTHKIFDNLIIISNKAEPESFHYEIVGECYEFAKDKKNMYIRQEATKELFQNSGYDIAYNENYKTLTENHREIKKLPGVFDKSTIFPAYYEREDRVNTIEDYYHQRPGEVGKDFSGLSGSEVVYYDTLNEFRIWTHSEGVDIQDEDKGRLRGNMNYKEDKWYVQVPSIHFVQKNEPDWSNVYQGKGDSYKVPIELQQANFIQAKTVNDVSPLDERGLVFWKDEEVRAQEAKLKDKYIKIRVRYSGKDLAVISALKTLYSISYA